MSRLLAVLLVLLFLMLPALTSSLIAAEDVIRPLSLTESIAIATEKSTFIRSAEQGIVGADYERKAARTDFLPKVRTVYSYTRYNEDPHVKSPAGEIGPIPFDMKTGKQDRYQWNTYLTQPLFTGGALTSSYQIAELAVDMARENRSRTEQDVILQVKEAYFTILKTEKIRTVAVQAVEQVKSHVEVSQAFYDQEMIPKNDLLQAEVRYALVKQDLIRADNGVQVAKASFNTVLRRSVNEPVELEDILVYQPEPISMDECLEKAMRRRSELKEAALNVERANKGVNLAKSRFVPTLSLIVNYQKMGDHANLMGNPYEDSESWTISPVFSWDIWEWGKKRYQLGASRVAVSQSEELKKQVTDSIALEVKTAYLYLVESEKNIAVAKTAIEQAEEDFRLNRERYSEQMATTTDVLDAQTRLTQQQNNYFNALSDYHIAKARLERAIGKE